MAAKNRVKVYVEEILKVFRHSTPRDYIALRNSLEDLSPTNLRRVYAFTRGYKEIIKSALGSPSSSAAIIGRMVESINSHKKDKGDLADFLEIELDSEPLLAEDNQRPDPSKIHEEQYQGTPKNKFDDHDYVLS